jgi:hypothetical protein
MRLIGTPRGVTYSSNKRAGGQGTKDRIPQFSQSVTGSRRTSRERTPFKLSVFRAIQLYAKILEEFNRLLWVHCLECGISKPGLGQYTLQPKKLGMKRYILKTFLLLTHSCLHLFQSSSSCASSDAEMMEEPVRKGSKYFRTVTILTRIGIKYPHTKLETVICVPFLPFARPAHRVPSPWEYT